LLFCWNKANVANRHHLAINKKLANFKKKKMGATDRLKILNGLFLQKAFQVNLEQVSRFLAEEHDLVAYSPRSFNRDIRELKELLKTRYPTLQDQYGELLRFARSTGNYVYVRDDISAFPTFSDSELNQIASSIEANKHLFAGGAGEGIVNKLRAIALENTLSNYHEVLAWSAIELVKDGARSGADLMPVILENIYAKRVVKFTHKGLATNSKQKQLCGLPVLLKEYNNGWYTGWYVLFQPVDTNQMQVQVSIESLQLFALDRIIQISSVNPQPRLRIHPDFQPAAYFKHTLGLFRSQSQKPCQIICRLAKDSWMLNYIEKYPIHESQQMVPESETTNQVHVNLEIDQEVVNFFFRYAQEIQVIEPISLVEKIKLGLNNGLSKYD
jgi:predicted DNA-binding transcriptional regulator YafY